MMYAPFAYVGGGGEVTVKAGSGWTGMGQ